MAGKMLVSLQPQYRSGRNTLGKYDAGTAHRTRSNYWVHSKSCCHFLPVADADKDILQILFAKRNSVMIH